MDLSNQNNEKELLQKISEGDENAFGTLFYQYLSLLNPYVISLVKSEAIAEEMIQDTFVRIWINRDKLTEIENPRAWIFRVASHECFNYLRRKLIEQKVLTRVGREKEEEQKAVGDPVQLNEIKSAIQESIHSMPPQRKLIYKMSREQGLKIPEIAEKLNLSPSTVKNTLRSALETIRNDLAKKGLLLSLLSFFVMFEKIFLME